jgi:toxin-antitoxin system PIN domain toxin
MKKGSSRRLLLDVNVLLALAWPNHQFHRAVLSRLERSTEQWSTCALTQLGFIRLSSNPAVVGLSKSPAEAAALLREVVEDPLHVYLETLPAPSDAPVIDCFARILGSKQVTDAYLLRLAQAHDTTLVTFDRRIQAMAEQDGRVEVLTA